MLEGSFARKEAEELSRRMSASETLEAGSMSYSVEKGTSSGFSGGETGLVLVLKGRVVSWPKEKEGSVCRAVANEQESHRGWKKTEA